MKQARSRGRSNDPVLMKNRILDASEALFQKQGYHSTSVHDVIGAAGVTGGAMHHHFPTKKDLGLAVIRERVGVAVRESWINPVRDAASLSSGIRGILLTIADGIDQRGSVAGCPLNNLAMELASIDPDFRKAVRSIFAEWQTGLSERIRRTRAGARMKTNEILEAARFLIFAYSGAMNVAKTEQNAAPLREASHALTKWMRENDLVG